MAKKKKQTEMETVNFGTDFANVPEEGFPPVFEFKEKGDELIGRLIEVKDLKVKVRRKMQDTRIGMFELENGERVTVWQTYKLEMIYGNASELLGGIFKIVYKGKVSIGGRQKMHDFDIQADPATVEKLKEIAKRD